MHNAADLFDFNHSMHAELFQPDLPAWAALSGIGAYLQQKLRPRILGNVSPGAYIGEQVFLDEGSVVEHGAVIKGPAWIGKNCVVRAGCYVRENVIVGDNVVLGNSCEFKNCLLFDNCEVPHYNYVGDAILGYRAHLGAGVVLSNVRLDRREVTVKTSTGLLSTGLKKFSALLGDHAEIGCNSVISPGSILGRRSIVYPLTHFGGVLPADSVLKTRQEHEVVARR
jgi:UDP-N-acetylglucosamine diphosphorylase / glucose-1-phosphate thymidylyltransferase / UDP-N-acetylgalactosamine diphosphorylase / glucosamine-1-phosphate N-acetyltransferase / galactosamine-1-phosphate N-acetyltransferase